MRVALVGTGLIGASVGLAAKQAGAEVVGAERVDRDQQDVRPGAVPAARPGEQQEPRLGA